MKDLEQKLKTAENLGSKITGYPSPFPPKPEFLQPQEIALDVGIC